MKKQKQIKFIIFILSISSAPLTLAQSKTVSFDKQRLKSLGLDPSLSDYFSYGNRFSPGNTNIKINLNGKNKLDVKANFDAKGDLCINNEMVKTLNLNIQIDNGSDDNCYKLDDYYRSASIDQHPDINEVDIIVPPEAIKKSTIANDVFSHGGSAGIINYDAYSMYSKYSASTVRNDYVNLEAGLNLKNWVYRSHQNFSGQNGDMKFSRTDSYLLRTLPYYNKQLQMGELNFNSTLLSGFPFTGVQLLPEVNSTMHNGKQVEVTGISQDGSSKVDVYQNGMLIYSTLVPVGPFTLTEIPVVSTSDDLHVEISASGQIKQRFDVPAYRLQQQTSDIQSGLSVAVGRSRLAGTRRRNQQEVASVADSWRLNQLLFMDAGFTVSKGYKNPAVSFLYQPSEKLSFKDTVSYSEDKSAKLSGLQNLLSASWSNLSGLSFSGSIATSNSGYRTFMDSQQNDKYSRQNLSWSAGTNIATENFGNFSANVNTSQYNGSGFTSRNFNLSWGRAFHVGNFSVNVQRQTRYTHGRRTQENILYLNYSVMVKNNSVNSYYRENKTTKNFGLTTSGDINTNNQYSLSIENDSKRVSAINSVSGGVNSNLHYTNLSVTADNSENMTNFSGSLSGGAVLHSRGLTFSSNKIDNTFGIVHLTPPQSGIEFNIPDGKAYSDFAGNAVVSRLTPWSENTVELNTENLPSDIDVPHSIQQYRPETGSVIDMGFKIERNRRVMLIVDTKKRYHLLTGSYLTTSTKGGYVTTAVEEGRFFINDISSLTTLYAHPVDMPSEECRLSFTLPEKPQINSSYEEVHAQCN